MVEVQQYLYAGVPAIAAAGFLTTWLGAALCIVPGVFALLRSEAYAASHSGPLGERMAATSAAMNASLRAMKTSRPAIWGHRLLAAGSSLLLIAGIVWLAAMIA